MKVLLVAATRAEIEPLLLSGNGSGSLITTGNHSIDILITGVGMVATAFALGRQLASHTYDLAINAGIAGSFDFNIALGEVVLITEDIFAEQGAEDGEEFIPLKELGLGENSQLAVGNWQQDNNSRSINNSFKSLEKIKQVKDITVNKVHGNEFSISKTLSRFDAQVESMEGAAFFYACNQTKTPCLQIRAISNYVERRDKDKWDIGLALKNLNEFLYSLILK